MLIDYIRDKYYIIKNLKYKRQYSSSPKTSIPDSGILFIGHDLENRGAEKLLYNIVKFFREKEIPVCVITFAYGPMWKEFQKLGPLIITKKNELPVHLKQLKAQGYKTVLCNTVTIGDIVPTLKHYDFRVVSLIHEMENVIKGGFLNHAKDIVRYADEVIFPSTFVYDSFCKAIEDKNFSYRVHNQGLYNMENKGGINTRKNKFFEKYSLPQDCKVILNVVTPASLRKGFDLFLKTADEAARRNKKFVFFWVGHVTWIMLWKILIKEHIKKPANVRFSGYISSIEEINEAYSCSDIFYLTSREDPFPSVVLEALSAGLPVVAFDKCGGFVDIVKDGKTGKLIEPFDYKNALDAIERLANDTQEYERISENCMLESKKHSFNEYCEFLKGLLEHE